MEPRFKLREGGGGEVLYSRILESWNINTKG